MNDIMWFVFIATFLNTGFLLPLADANFKNQFPSWLKFVEDFFENHRDHDFNSRWFKSVGETMVSAVFVNIFMPTVAFLGAFLIRRVRICIDRGGCSKQKRATSCVSMQNYIDLYAGPEYDIHFKYSLILTMVFLTLTFGVGIPVLFPLCFLFLFIFYILEKATLFYFYRLPPAIDEQLNNNVLEIFKYAPTFVLGFGYWFISNKQLINNDKLKP